MGEDGGDEGGFLPILYADGYRSPVQPYVPPTPKVEQFSYRTRFVRFLKKLFHYSSRN